MAKPAPRQQRFGGPSAAVCTAATRALASLHGLPSRPAAHAEGDVRQSCGAAQSVLEAVVRTMLSQNTTNKNSTAAMNTLLATFGRDWQAMRRSTPQAIAESIAVGGLGKVKGRRIHALLCQLEREQGSCSLEHIRLLSDDEAKAALTAYDGIGPKTAACVLLFCLGRDSFAVDTHVLRIAKRLRWVPQTATREQAYERLDAAVPRAQKYALHVLLVEHGKCCLECAANQRPQRPPVGPCPLQALVAKAARRAAQSAAGAGPRPPPARHCA